MVPSVHLSTLILKMVPSVNKAMLISNLVGLYGEAHNIGKEPKGLAFIPLAWVQWTQPLELAHWVPLLFFIFF